MADISKLVGIRRRGGARAPQPSVGNTTALPITKSVITELQTVMGPTTTQCPINGVQLLAEPTVGTTISRKERLQKLIEATKQERELPTCVITGSLISTFSWEDMQRIAVVRVTNSSLAGQGSVNDPRFGVVSMNEACPHCDRVNCPGHYGLIDFGGKYVPNPVYIRRIVSVLRCVCNSCGKLLLSPELIKEEGYDKLSFDKRLQAMEEHSEKLLCTNPRPTSTAGGPIQECTQNPRFVTAEIKKTGIISYEVGEKVKKSKDSKVKAQTFNMKFSDIYNILNSIDDEDNKLMGFGAAGVPSKAVNMMLLGLLVPPVIARPPVPEGASINMDLLTTALASIAAVIYGKQNSKRRTANAEPIELELYAKIRQIIFKSDDAKVNGRDLLTIIERFQGKKALMRKSLMSKRNDQCARTVAGPDPSLRFGEISLPESWAPILTKPVLVNESNIAYLTSLLAQGKIVRITQKATGLRERYDPKYKYTLKIGDIVDRWSQNGDLVIINRQPTLHSASMMKYIIVYKPQLTIGLHLSYTTPMNCDFDGDENNAWNPQSFIVDAELEELLDVRKNIMSAEQNRPNMGMVMNSVTAMYLLSLDTTIIDDSLFHELFDLITERRDLPTLSNRLYKYGVHHRSGRAILSALFPADFYYFKEDARNDVKIVEGILVSGKLTKAHVGSSHRGIIQEMHKKYGPDRTSSFYTDAPYICNKWLIERGFTVGMADCINYGIDEQTGETYDISKRILDEKLALIYAELEALGGKLADPVEESIRQKRINNLVNTAAGIGLKLASDVLKGDNAIGIMGEKGAGTKGSTANVGQIMGSVGQQYYRGNRLPAKLSGGRRLLPMFDMDDEHPEARGFVPQSFFTGVTPAGLFFLQAGGREGLLDTAVGTQKSGTIHHKMIKAFENIIVAYDGSLRNTIGTLFNPLYNSGYNPSRLLKIEVSPGVESTVYIDLKTVIKELNYKRGWVLAGETSKFNEKRREIPTPANETILPPLEFNDKPPVTTTEELPPREPSKIRITKFERGRIIGVRAMQISNGRTPLIDTAGELDPVKIATKEYEAGILKLFVVRVFSDGSIQRVYPTLDNI